MAEANKLEEILQLYKRPCKVTGLVDAPMCWRVKLEPENTLTVNGGRGMRTRVAHLKTLAPDIAAALGVGSVRVTQDSGGMWLEVPKQRREVVYTRDVVRRVDARGVPFVLGVGMDGRPVVVDLAKPHTPNVLIGGTTGSGKSQLLHSLVYGLARFKRVDELGLVLVDTNAPPRDAKRGSPLRISENDGLAVWRELPHVDGVVARPAQAVEALVKTMALLRGRYAAGGWSKHYVLVIDELADLLLDPEYGKRAHELLVEAAQICRKQGVSIVAATQRPSYDMVRGALKANFPVRVAMTTASGVDSRVVIDQKGAERLTGRGDGLLRVGMEVTRFQGGLVEDRDVEEVTGREVEVRDERGDQWIFELAKKAERRASRRRGR
jgi:S-DNA-T family DNA segregation ATPase FtsK/SpoIIIE